MKVFYPAALMTLLMMALAGVSHSAQADRDNRRSNDHRADDSSMHSHSIETRGNGHHSSRPADNGGSRTEWRERNDANLRPSDGYRHANDRDNDRYDNNRRYENRNRGVNSQEQLLNQRFYDDRRDNSSYYRRDNPRPVNDVIREVQHQYGGQVIGVQNSEGGSMYRVRVLQHDGRVKTVLVPAE